MTKEYPQVFIELTPKSSSDIIIEMNDSEGFPFPEIPSILISVISQPYLKFSFFEVLFSFLTQSHLISNFY